MWPGSRGIALIRHAASTRLGVEHAPHRLARGHTGGGTPGQQRSLRRRHCSVQQRSAFRRPSCGGRNAPLGPTQMFRRKGMRCLTSIPPFPAETSSARFRSSCATASGSLRERVSASPSVPSRLSFGVLPWPPVSSWEFTASVRLLRVHHKFKLPRIESPFARADHRSRSSQPRHRNRGHPGARAYDGSSIPRHVARPLCRFCVVIAAARD